MLDAFIIDQLRRDQGHPDKEFVPLTLELPVPEEEIRDEKEKEEKKPPEKYKIRF